MVLELVGVISSLEKRQHMEVHVVVVVSDLAHELGLGDVDLVVKLVGHLLQGRG